MIIRRVSQLLRYDSFEDRYEYLKLSGVVGADTFGFDRHINQKFYRSTEWRRARELVMIRDNGCDLGVPGYEIQSEVVVHHLNPMTADDIIHGEDWIFDPEYLVTTTPETHNAIHYGDASLLRTSFIERTPGDTKLW